MNFTLSGGIGTGKSTIGEMLADYFRCDFVDCGQLYRNYAKEHGRNVLEQNKSKDVMIDTMIDEKITEIGQNSDRTVFVSRTAWHFVPDAIHVYLMADEELAAKRIFERQSNAEKHNSPEDVLKYNRERLAEEDARYCRMYGITREQQLANATMFVHIGNRQMIDVFAAIKNLVGVDRQVLCFDPHVALPTEGIRDINPERVKNEVAVLKTKSSKLKVAETPIRMEVCGDKLYILDGHHRVAAACQADEKFLYTFDFQFVKKPSVELRQSDYYDWYEYCKAR